MKRTILLTLLALFAMALHAQKGEITGTIIDRDTHDTMMHTTVQLLRQDSTFIGGSLTDEDGQFTVKVPRDGKYIIKVTSVGYATLFKNVSVADSQNVDLGKLGLKADAISLKGATITERAAKVTLKEDTFVYNATAYRTPEGSVAEELVKRLPGASIDDDGKITINGKEVKKIKVDGKEFMVGDTKTAMKNLPTSIINKVRAYDEKSDLARVTGIDDGNEQTVLDFGLKPGANKGFFSNVDASYGTHDRFAEKLMGAFFNSKIRTMVFGNANNTNDMGFPGGGGRGNFGRGRNGLNTSKMVGGNFNYDNGKTFQFDGSLRWNHNNSDQRTKQSAENFVSSSQSFSNSLSQSYSRSDSWNAQMRMEWKPDTMTNIMFRPSFSYTASDSRSTNNSASFNDDPYDYVDDPLDGDAISQMAAKNVMVNTNRSTSLSYSNSKNVGGSLQYNRKFGSMGRNINLRVEGNYSTGDSKSLSVNNVHLYQIQNIYGADSTYQTNRYNLTPTKNWSYSAQATYSEPLWKATFLQFSYKFNYSFSKSDRATYDFSNLGEDFFGGVSNTYRNWNGYLSRLDNPYTDYKDETQSRYSEYKNYTHDIEMMFRMIRSKYQFNVGVMLQPQSSHFLQDYLQRHTDTTRTVVNFTPTMDFRYRFSKVSNLRIRYRGSTSQPSMSDLIDVTDDSDPLNVTKGNPGLKPSFTNRFNLFYNTYNERRKQAIMTFLNFQTTRNSISRKVTYDEQTGGRTTMPMNINGNWNLNGALMFNTAIDTAGYWNVNTSTDYSYNNYVGYISLDRNSDSQRNLTRSLSLSERLAGSYRNDWLEVELDGSFNYMHTRNKLQSQSNLDTWQFAYGGTINLTAPWGTTLSTDLHQNSRRGYNDKSMNTNELIWNAQLSQSFLRGNALTVSLQYYDILNNQSNFSRTISSMQRSDTEYNSINSYAMLHVIYRVNLFGNKDARREMHGRGDRFGGPGGPPPGGGGGMRPPRGGGFGRPMM